MTEDRQAVLAWLLIAAGVVTVVKGVKLAWWLREEKQRRRLAERMNREARS